MADFEVVDLGVHFPDQFNGFGVSFTRFEDSTYGIGATFNDALDNALETLYLPGNLELCQEIWEQEKLSDEDDAESQINMDEVEENDEYPFYHVGIRYTV